VEIRNKSFRLFQQLIDLDTKEVKCICHTVMVCFDPDTKTSCPVSDTWRVAITQFEGNPALLKTESK
jgi:acyl-CoA thioester hydrolase